MARRLSACWLGTSGWNTADTLPLANLILVQSETSMVHGSITIQQPGLTLICHWKITLWRISGTKWVGKRDAIAGRRTDRKSINGCASHSISSHHSGRAGYWPLHQTQASFFKHMETMARWRTQTAGPLSRPQDVRGTCQETSWCDRRTLPIWLLSVNPILLITNIKLEKEWD